MQRELKHILPYIQHGLTCNLMGEVDENNDIAYVFTVTGINQQHVDIDSGLCQYDIKCEEFFPLLRPMSDLFENIVHNGEILCVAKLIKNIACEHGQERYEVDHGEGVIRDWKTEKTIPFEYSDFLEFWIVEILNEYHFDWRYDLILKGLAEPIVNDKTKA